MDRSHDESKDTFSPETGSKRDGHSDPVEDNETDKSPTLDETAKLPDEETDLSGSRSTPTDSADFSATAFATPGSLQTAAELISRVGDFEIDRRLGRGGMGVVYLARDTKLKRLVAVKVLRSGTDAESHELERFRREAQVIAQIRHPHIVQVFEVGEQQGLMYLVLEYMNGGALNEYLDGTPLNPDTAARIVANLADAAAAAHRQGVVHRDLKPGNILVALPENAVQPDERLGPQHLVSEGVEFKLADFGLAKSIDANVQQTHTGGLVGTPRYAAPEQFTTQTNAISPATDVYALGAILYELMTGSSVYRAVGLADLLVAVRDQEPVSPRVMNSRVSKDLETICLKCLQKSSANRYSSADELRDDLQRLLKGEPIVARPIGRAERTLKWVRRHPLTAALSAAIAVATLAVVGFVVSLLYQDQLQEVNSSLVQTQGDLKSANASLEKAQADLKSRNSQLEEKNTQLNAAIEKANQATELLARFRYAIDMQVASRAWSEGDIAQMTIILDRNRQIDDQMKGWEWNYLNGLLHSELAHLHGQTAQFSPDGKFLAVGRAEGVVLLDANTFELIREYDGPDQWPTRIAFSGDGSRLLAGCAGEKFLFWEVAKPDLVTHFTKHSWGGETALNHDGSLALTTGWGDDRTIKLWRTSDQEILLDRHAGGGQYARGAAFSPDGKWFAYGWPPTNTIQLAKVDTPDETIEISLGDSTYYHFNDPAVRFHPTRPQLFVSTSGTVYTIDLPEASAESSATSASSDGVIAMPAKEQLDVASKQENDSDDQSEIRAVPTKMKGSVLSISEDGKMLFTSVADNHSVAVWNIDQQRQWNSIRGQSGDVTELSLQNRAARTDNTWVSISASPGGYLFLRDCFRSPDYERLLLGFTPSKLAFSPDGTQLAAAGFGGKVVIWSDQQSQNLSGASGSPWGISFSPDGKQLALASSTGQCFVWSVDDGALVHSLRVEGIESCYGLAYNAKGDRLAVGCDAGHIVVWDTVKGIQVARHRHDQEMVSRLLFHPQTDELVSSAFKSLMFWGSSPPRRLEGVYAPGLQFTHDGAFLLARGGQVESDELLVDALTGKIDRTFQGHQATISDSVLLRDQSRLITVGDTNGRAWGTGTMRVWDFLTGEEVARIDSGGARTVTASPDGSTIAISSMDGAVRLYDADRFESAVKSWNEMRDQASNAVD